MPKASKKKGSDVKPKIPDIPWRENDNFLTWQFLTELERHENYRIIFGKKDVSENTSGDSRTTVFKRIAERILPEIYLLDPGTIGDRLRAYLDRLRKAYQKHATKLRQTGEGLNNTESESTEELLDYYVPPEGPDESTPTRIVNIWQQIEREFEFFPRLHNLYATRPNVTPIVITTAVGPQGRKTVWYQPPSPTDVEPIGPCSNSVEQTINLEQSLDEATQPSQLSVTLSTTSGSDTLGPISSSQIRPPKSSTISRHAVEKARNNISKVPAKRSLIDTLVEMSDKTTKMWSEDAHQKSLLQKRTLLLEEFKLGLWSKNEYHAQIHELQHNNTQDSLPRVLLPSHQRSLEWEEEASTDGSD
ncbi:hypothetical protein JR316_0007545 [Psilocybe cubensis]|uniref:Uncharacterized protein n=2 Tax=Psilocybe cubensis TaxID=181762 RepID=A0ACB8GZ66_PSICU|nr:hypothetical protein JR316_0007545 [Psilocybe cubensis]KAH9480938.1 hypothetical protein JR316_0007545 [Psilocybe cubensis]